MFRGSIILATCIFVVALAIIGCGGGGGDGGSNPVGVTVSNLETASLSGTVIFDDVPLANAAVFLYKSEKAHTIGLAQLPALRSSLIAQKLISDGAYSTTTNASGTYSFVDIPVGQYTLIAVKDENNQFAQTGVLLGSVTTLNAQLTPTGKISGKVQVTVGGVAQNVSGALVYVAGTSYVALTDTLGNFVINNVPSNVLTTSTAYEVRVMPGHGDVSPASGVRVNPGETTAIPTFALTIPTVNYAILSGKLIPGAGLTSADMANHFVIITHQADGTIMGTRTDASGNYQFSVTRAGTYLVMCVEEKYNYNPDPLSVVVTALSNTTLTISNITVLSATIQTTGSIIGEVTAAGLPVTGAIVHLAGTSLLGVSDTAGKFVIERVPAITAPSSYSVEVSSNNGIAPAKTGIVVNVGQITNIGVFSITRPAAGYKNIVGTLTPVLPVTQAMLTNRLVQLTSPDGKVSAVYSNSVGGFIFMATQTGIHNVTVMDSELTYAPRTQNVTVAALDNAALPLSTIISVTDPGFDNTGSIIGEVTAAGLPVTGAIVHLAGTSLLGVSNTAGKFVIERVPTITAPSSYSVEVSSNDGMAPAKTGIVVSAGQATNVGVFAVIRPAAGYKNIVGTLTPVLPVTPAMLTSRLVQLTSPDGKTSAAYSNAVGGFIFMATQTGIHNVTVMDSELTYAPRTQNVTVAALDNATLPLSTMISVTDPGFDNRVSVDGTVFKDIKIRPEIDESGVSVKFVPQSTTEETLFTFTRADGSFNFLVVPGTYTLSIEGLYQLNPPSPVTVNITSPYSFASTLHVRPSQTVTSVVEGSVNWPAIAGWTFTEGEVILEGTTFVDHRIISSTSPASFRFENVPPGAYTLKTNPFRNGYDGSIALSVAEGINITGQSLATTFIAPFVTTSSTAGYTLSLLGQNFGVTASMKGYVDDKPLPQTGIWNATNCSFNITSLSPGEHSIQLIKDIAGSKLAGNKSIFNRPILSPLQASFIASSTDTTITFSWQNEPFINELEIRLLQGVTIVRPLQRVLGSSVTYDKLQPGVSYTIEVSSTYPNVPTSSPTSFSFSTKAESINNIASFAFTGAGIATGTVFGFEVVNGVAYIGFENGTDITIQSFDLTTKALLNSSTPITTSGDVAMRSMAANSSGVYLTYSTGDITTYWISSFNATLGLTNSKDLITDLGFAASIDMATVRSLNDRIFLIVRDGPAQPMTTYLQELDLSLAMIQAATPLSGASNAIGKAADVAYDRITNTIYLVYPNDSYYNSAIAFNNMDLTGPVIPIGEFASADKVILGLYANNDKIYLAEQAISFPNFYPTASVMDAKSGYLKLITSAYPGSFGFDRQNNIWASSMGFDLKYLFQIDNSLNILQSLKVFNTAFLDLNLPISRLDNSNGLMYMLHFNAANALAVYRYDSNF